MKKLISLVLALLMAVSAAYAEPDAEENAFLTQEELEMYLTVLAGDALAMGIESQETDPETGITTVIYAGGASLRIADEQLTASSAVIGATLNEAQEDLRGIHLGESLADVLGVYPNDNPNLYGTRYDAALFVNDERPQASVGYILRDGQRITDVVYLVFTWEEDGGVVRSGISYTFEYDAVSAIEIFGLDSHVEEADALEEISNVAQMQENNEYSAYPVSVYGGDLKPFNGEDLMFSGLDFVHMTPEDAVNMLGETPVDDWMEDSTGEWLRTRQWDGISIIFVYDSQKNFLFIDSLTVLDDMIEGPRAVRIDDTMESVMNRFLHGENTTLSNGIALYGDGENAPYGVLAYAEFTTTLTYVQKIEDGRSVIWQLTFADGLLQSYRMLLR